MRSAPIIFNVHGSKHDAQDEAQKQTSTENEVQLHARDESRVSVEGTRAAEVANAKVDELGEGEGQCKRKSHGDECKATKASTEHEKRENNMDWSELKGNKAQSIEA